jgi:tRNA (cmo5U34)-methyltransferase
MAGVFDRMAPVMVPGYEFIQDEVLRLLDIGQQKAFRVVELGAGSGRFLEKILKAAPSATCCWVDSSSDFLSIARSRLGAYEERVEYVSVPFEENWSTRVEGDIDAIVSFSAIHHLTHEEKRSLYQRCFTRLRPGGLFINADEMKTMDEDAYVNSLRFWVQHAANVKASITKEDKEHYDRWMFHFDKWKERNVDNIHVPKVKGDDIHDPFLEQMQWLREIGFTDVDLFVKYHLWCVVGGRKKR